PGTARIQQGSVDIKKHDAISHSPHRFPRYRSDRIYPGNRMCRDRRICRGRSICSVPQICRSRADVQPTRLFPGNT
ncbi:MAG: hypothetical protein KDA89_03570, partial [Planctomycetaceae bacterium]|nr:hypothetical protein [Planctomycetaceae bacterium]